MVQLPADPWLLCTCLRAASALTVPLQRQGERLGVGVTLPWGARGCWGGRWRSAGGGGGVPLWGWIRDGDRACGLSDGAQPAARCKNTAGPRCQTCLKQRCRSWLLLCRLRRNAPDLALSTCSAPQKQPRCQAWPSWWARWVEVLHFLISLVGVVAVLYSVTPPEVNWSACVTSPQQL